MHAAQVEAWGQPPVYREVPDPGPPGPGQVRVRLLASAVHRLVQLRAAGKHYSAKTLPLDPGADGVGRDEQTGTAYYISTFAAPVFAEYANVDAARLARLPAGADPVAVAVLLNPLSSSWMSLKTRVDPPPGGFSVLVLGVTGMSGSAAIGVARQLGATRVVGAARNLAAMDALAGLDQRVVLRDPPEDTDFASVGHVDVILDYVYGRAAAALLAAVEAPPDRPVQYVQIGALGNDETLALPAQLLRSKAIKITGSAPGSWSMPEMARELPAMLELAATLDRPKNIVTCSLKDVAEIWDSEDAKRKRLVLVP